VDLRRVAEWAQTTLSDIRVLNPELRRWTTPVTDSAYELRVPVGAAELVSERLSEAPETNLASFNWYTVKKGETLLGIARKLNVSRSDLAEANYLRTTSKVSPGQKLMVPHEATALTARADRPIPVADSRTLAADAVVPAVAGVSPEKIKVVYEVQKGDTLASIARLFRTTVAALQTWNRIPGNAIRAGERLTIYTVAAN
jgi:membrane-bound lytic murein transglycosylase D